jgi:hypothetical protein
MISGAGGSLIRISFGKKVHCGSDGFAKPTVQFEDLILGKPCLPNFRYVDEWIKETTAAELDMNNENPF